jgi:hypothetical protein
MELIVGTEYVNIDIFDNNFKKIDTALLDAYELAGGTGTTITLNNVKLVNYVPKTFIASANNNGAGTTINGKQLYKPGTSNAPTLIKDKAYEIWYNSAGDCFFLKASATGKVTSEKVLAGETYSTEVDTDLVGTMPNKGAITMTPSTTNQTISLGYHNGNGYVVGDSDLVSGNIRAGVNIFGVQGSGTVVDTSNAVLYPEHLLVGDSGYDDGILKVGTMPNRSNENWHQPSLGDTVSNANGYGAYVIPPAGYYNGSSWVRSLQPDLLASNIISGKSIFGIAGSATIASLGGKQFISGTSTPYVTGGNAYINLSSIGFVPTMFIGVPNSSFYYTVSTYTYYLRPSGQFMIIYNNGTQFAGALVGYDTVGGRNTSLFTANVDYGSTFSVDMNNFPVLRLGNVSSVSGTISWIAI